VLNFGSASTGSPAAAEGLVDIGTLQSVKDAGSLNVLDPNVPLLSKNDLNIDWMEDFPDDEEDSGLKDSNDDDCVEDPILELGIYNPEKDLQGWSFADLFEDNQ
jgi:hypothetical protein